MIGIFGLNNPGTVSRRANEISDTIEAKQVCSGISLMSSSNFALCLAFFLCNECPQKIVDKNERKK